MGMSIEQYEAQKRRRFAVLSMSDARALGSTEVSENNDFGFCVCEMHDGRVIRYLGDDVAEPEDKLLCRDFAWVADELNRVAAPRANPEPRAADGREVWVLERDGETLAAFCGSSEADVRKLAEGRNRQVVRYVPASHVRAESAGGWLPFDLTDDDCPDIDEGEAAWIVWGGVVQEVPYTWGTDDRGTLGWNAIGMHDSVTEGVTHYQPLVAPAPPAPQSQHPSDGERR